MEGEGSLGLVKLEISGEPKFEAEAPVSCPYTLSDGSTSA
jgi:hypothetical protein